MNIKFDLNDEQAERFSNILSYYLGEFYHGSKQCVKDNEIITIVQNAIDGGGFCVRSH